VNEKVKQYLRWGCKTKIVLLTREEHEKLHRDALAQYKGAVVHNFFAFLHSGESYYPSISLNLGVRRSAWQRRVEIWNEPERVQFT